MTLNDLHRIRGFAGGVLLALGALLVLVAPVTTPGMDTWEVRSFAVLVALAGVAALPFDYASILRRGE